VLTQNLPRIYHATANINKLEETLAQCWDHQLVRDSELLTLRRFLLEDYWLNDNRAALAKLAKDVLEQARWGKKTSHTQRQLAAPALSALARVKLLEGDCFAARQVYLDYEFENPEIDESWLGDNITIPSRLLCRPAPGLPPATWVHGDAPASKPGRVTLLQFLDPASSPSMTTIEPANELVKAAGEKVQVVTLFPLAARLVDPVEQTIHSALEENDFRAKLEAVATGMKVQHPWGVLEGGRGDPALAAYGVNRYPTLVLIQPDGTVAAYHPFSSFDRGWQVLVEHLPAAQ
jgi:hypothetical protein